MSKLTKRQKEIQSRIVHEKQYTVEEAVQILNDLPPLKFKESIDIAINTAAASSHSTTSFIEPVLATSTAVV